MRWRHILGQPWRKFQENLEGGDRDRGAHSRVRGGVAGVDKRGVVYSGMETGDSHEGR